MPAAVIREVAGLARIRIVLGVSGYIITTPQAGPSQGQSGTSARTAAQAACR